MLLAEDGPGGTAVVGGAGYIIAGLTDASRCEGAKAGACTGIPTLPNTCCKRRKSA
jgi:hypothetical protein